MATAVGTRLPVLPTTRHARTDHAVRRARAGSSGASGWRARGEREAPGTPPGSVAAEAPLPTQDMSSLEHDSAGAEERPIDSLQSKAINLELRQLPTIVAGVQRTLRRAMRDAASSAS